MPAFYQFAGGGYGNPFAKNETNGVILLFMTKDAVGWFEKGGVNATCHVRGGGVYGREWYEAGKGATKRNTWMDAIAC